MDGKLSAETMVSANNEMLKSSTRKDEINIVVYRAKAKDLLAMLSPARTVRFLVSFFIFPNMTLNQATKEMLFFAKKPNINTFNIRKNTPEAVLQSTLAFTPQL